MSDTQMKAKCMGSDNMIDLLILLLKEKHAHCSKLQFDSACSC